MAACPTEVAKCGPNVIKIKSHRTQPVELKLQDFTEKDSCTWLIEAECGLPSITITDQTENIGDLLDVRFIEYEVDSSDATKVDAMGYPTAAYRATLQEYVFPEPWIANHGDLQLLQTASGQTVPGSELHSQIARSRDSINRYLAFLPEYEQDVALWDADVDARKKLIQDQIDRSQVPAEPSGGLLDGLFDLFGGADEEPEDVGTEVVELPPLPEKPVPPMEPVLYFGATLEDLTPVIGYGSLSAGAVAIQEDSGVKKSFGVGGQGRRGEENYGFTANSINAGDKCMKTQEITLTAAEQDALKTSLGVTELTAEQKVRIEDIMVRRYYILSAYPKIQLDTTGKIMPWSQRNTAQRLKFTVQSEFINPDYDFVPAEAPRAAVQPKTEPSEERLEEYRESFALQLQAVVEGSSALYASAAASAVALAALTLY